MFTKRFVYESAQAYLRFDGPQLAKLHSVYSEHRGQRHATTLLLEICEFADRNKITMYLNVGRFGYSDDQSPDNTALQKWYAKFGFYTIDRKKPVQMNRDPQNLASTRHA